MHRLKQFTTTIIVSGLSFFGLSAQADDSLGIGVQVVESSQGDLSMGNRAWFGIEPGESGSAAFKVISQSDVEQTISYEVFDVEIVNGQTQVDTSELSETSQWLSFEPAVAIIPAGGSREVAMTYDIPENAPEEAFEAVLRVLATGGSTQVESQAGSKAVVGTAVGVDIEVWLGVGDAVSLLPNFDITDIQGVILPQGRFLRVEFENLGLVPLALRGSVQFADPILVERSFEPTKYVARVIQGGESGYVDVPVVDEITDGNWNVFVSATQAQVRQTKLFEKNIEFEAPSEGGSYWVLIQSVLVALFAVLAVYGLRRVLRSSAQHPKQENNPSIIQRLKAIRVPRLRIPKLNVKFPKPSTRNKTKEQDGQPAKSWTSENREWANTRGEYKPLTETPRYRPSAKVEVDEDQLEQAIQRALLKVLENTAKSTEEDVVEPKKKAKPRKKPD